MTLAKPLETQPVSPLEQTFSRLAEALLADLKADEQLKLTLQAEQSQFVRFNAAKVRQTGCITDGSIALTLMQNQRNAYRSLPCTGNWDSDWPQAKAALAELRQELPDLPLDPYLVLPTGNATSRDIQMGHLLAPELVAATLLPEVAGLDFTGIYAGGSDDAGLCRLGWAAPLVCHPVFCARLLAVYARQPGGEGHVCGQPVGSGCLCRQAG